MNLNDFDYDLPESLIAKFPTKNRDGSRLLVIDRDKKSITDEKFTNLINHLHKDDLLVFNDSRVMQARLYGNKDTGGKIECLIEKIYTDYKVSAHIKSSRSPAINQTIFFANVAFKVLSKSGSLFEIEMIDKNITIHQLMQKNGHIPLPPYMNREDEISDKERYQTVYSKDLGSVAAPTAGLHFTESLIEEIKNKGVSVEFITLHVGAGTFQPVQIENINEHKMHSEYLEVSQKVCDKIIETKSKNGRIIAVGTTAVRSLESACQNGEIHPYYGESNIFIYPGKSFKIVDAMVTNFHLPKSTLLMLVSAFSSTETIKEVYKHAIEEKYRFFSYGDAMFIK